MINVIHVLSDSNIGGAGIVLLNILRSYNREKLQISVILPKDALLVNEVKKLNVNVIELDGINENKLTLANIKLFKNTFKELKPDVVHTHSSIAARIAAKELKIPVVNTRHCLEAKKKFPKNLVYSFLNNKLSDISIGVSKATVDNLIQDGIKEEKCKLVYNGASPVYKSSDDEKAQIKEKYSICPTDLIIGTVGRLEEVKNQKLFLEMAAKLLNKNSNYTFIIVGTGSLENELKQYAANLGIQNKVVFTGYLNNVSPILNILDVFVLTSNSEAFPLSLLEAMSLSKVCVSTPTDGPSEILCGTNGLITSDFSSDSLFESIADILSNDEKRKLVEENAKTTIDNNFTLEIMSNKLLEIYSDLKDKSHE